MDFEKLRKQGDIIPERNEYYLYRGVSGDPTPEILNGISWTGNLDLAHWFAMRYADFGNPSVYTTTVKKDSILFRTNVRDEDEYVLNPGKFEAQFLTQAYEEIAEKYQVTMDQEKAKELAKLMAHKD
jgi:hypothetical protein